MIQVPGWVVVTVMVTHAMLAVFNERINEVTNSPVVGVVVAAALVGLNILQSQMKSITTALKTLGRK